MWESRGRVALGFLVTVSKERPKLVNPGVLFDLVCLTFYFHTVCVETYLTFYLYQVCRGYVGFYIKNHEVVTVAVGMCPVI